MIIISNLEKLRIYENRLSNALKEKKRMEGVLLKTENKVRIKKRKERISAIDRRITDLKASISEMAPNTKPPTPLTDAVEVVSKPPKIEKLVESIELVTKK